MTEMLLPALFVEQIESGNTRFARSSALKESNWFRKRYATKNERGLKGDRRIIATQFYWHETTAQGRFQDELLTSAVLRSQQVTEFPTAGHARFLVVLDLITDDDFTLRPLDRIHSISNKNIIRQVQRESEARFIIAVTSAFFDNLPEASVWKRAHLYRRTESNDLYVLFYSTLQAFGGGVREAASTDRPTGDDELGAVSGLLSYADQPEFADAASHLAGGLDKLFQRLGHPPDSTSGFLSVGPHNGGTQL
ncbi:hypothetical protein [Streptomyces sp. NPDC019890]|uniref:hypothetical protein n=1 Tax=Streptomyces sp. NPDC019890 TaxID=3365064 RepID=UPI00384B4CE8